jgi:hypothetical protein
VHVNTQVRHAVRDRIEPIMALKAVFTNRSADIVEGSLPAAVIQTTTDDVVTAAKAGKDSDPLERRTITLSVVVVADGRSEELDDELDAVRAEIEARMGADDTLGGIAKKLEHRGADLDMMTDEDGDRWYAFLALAWEIEVWTEQGNPEVAV